MRRSRPERTPTFKEAVLILDNGVRMRVAIKDLSAAGARIEFLTRTDLPSRVMLVEPSLRIKCAADVVWQQGGAAGLLFRK